MPERATGAGEGRVPATLDRPTPQERADYVERTCAGDQELLRRVRELLGCHEQSRGPLDAPPRDLIVGPAVGETLPGQRPGGQVGPYELLEAIGEGGMG